MLKDVLHCTRRVQVGGSSRRVDHQEINLCALRDDEVVGPHLVIPAGLRNRVMRTLASYDVPYTYEDARPVNLGKPVWSAVDEPREGQAEILGKIVTCDMGQIEAPTGDGKTWLIVQVCKMYPKAKIIIVVPGIGEAKTVRDRLLSVFSTLQVGQLGGGRRESGCRITVCVKNSLRKAELDKCQLLIYDECHTAGGDKTSQQLSFAKSCKKFGFSASPELRSDGTNLLVESLFGPIIHVTTYQQSQKRGNVVPLMVIMRSVPNGPSCSSSRSDVINRHCLWRNEVRNQLIANDMAMYAQADKQVLTAVATVEHGLELVKFDRAEYRLVYGNMNANMRIRYEKSGVIQPGEHPITTWEREQLQEQFEAGTLKRVITTCWNQGVDFGHLQVVIRADGVASGIRNIQLPGRLSRLDDGKSYGMLIDYMDQWHPALHRRAQARMRMYRKKGWTVQLPKKTGES
jgi:superfamily II DNA or RNA helicase